MKASQRILRMLANDDVPAWRFAQVGILRYGARIWEMNHRGLSISWRYKDNKGKSTHNTIYRLTTPLKQVDFEKCCLKQE